MKYARNVFFTLAYQILYIFVRLATAGKTNLWTYSVLSVIAGAVQSKKPTRFLVRGSKHATWPWHGHTNILCTHGRYSINTNQ